MQWGTSSHMQGGPCRSRHQAHSLGGYQAGPPHHTFWHVRHVFHTCQGKQPTRGQSSRGQQHGQEPACHTRARIPHQRQHHPLIFESAAHHWEWQCRSRAHPLGDSRADSFRYLPDTHDPHFAHVEVSSPQKGLSKCNGSIAVDQRAILGCASPIIESSHTAAMHGGKEASWPRSPVSYTTCEQRDHHAQPPSSITTWVTQAADAFAKALPSSTSPWPLAYARSEGECCKNRGRALGPRTILSYIS